DNLRQYYRKLDSNEGLRPFYRYNWHRRTEPMAHQLQALPIRSQPWRILDAGCGVGTESLFWATVREDVTILGVDAHQPRIETAVARLPEWEQRLQRPLSLQFQCQNIFDVLGQQTFDLIWSMEAISHIDPAETFLSAAWSSLAPGGCLVISDSHLLDPAMARR
ncbi:MAG: class I SAM-dependent methyltransferase, partial [Anaerolineae bacterium]